MCLLTLFHFTFGEGENAALFFSSRRRLLRVFYKILTTGHHTSLTACRVAGLIGGGGLCLKGACLLEFTRFVGGETRDGEGKVLNFIDATLVFFHSRQISARQF